MGHQTIGCRKARLSPLKENALSPQSNRLAVNSQGEGVQPLGHPTRVYFIQGLRLASTSPGPIVFCALSSKASQPRWADVGVRVLSNDTGWAEVPGKVSLTMDSIQVGVIIHFLTNGPPSNPFSLALANRFFPNSRANMPMMLCIWFLVGA